MISDDLYERLVDAHFQANNNVQQRDQQLLLMVARMSLPCSELSSVLASHLVLDEPLDADFVIDLLGTVEYYMAALRNALKPLCGVTRNEVLMESSKLLTGGAAPFET